MSGFVGFPELLLLGLVLLLLFGPTRLPEIARSLGKGMREFKDSISGAEHHDDSESISGLPAAPDTAGASSALPARVREND